MMVNGNTALAEEFEVRKPGVCAIKMPVRKHPLSDNAYIRPIKRRVVTRTPDIRIAYKRLCTELSRLTNAELSEFERQLDEYANSGKRGVRLGKYLEFFEGPRRSSCRPEGELVGD